METYTAIGVMSGSSLDGLDLALCEFKSEDNWSFKVLKTYTYTFPEEWRLRLFSLPSKNRAEISKADIEFGQFIGEKVNEFLLDDLLKPDLIASHGHTIFHAPEKGFTLQIGDGQTIADLTGITTINDFRSKDIELGGQGAPLVPIGDEFLFKAYDFCLNIGGIANISFDEDGDRIAFDVCAANQLLNYLSRQLGAPFDKGGSFAQLGKLNLPLFKSLNNDAYFIKETPKSLSNQYVQSTFKSILDTSEAPVEDKLYTVIKHIAFQVNKAVKNQLGNKILITGGGAHNHFLRDAIAMETKLEIADPSNEIIDFKEAIIFAFMGVLRLRDDINCLASVTGAAKDSCSGIINRVNAK